MNKLRHIEVAQSVKWFNAAYKENGVEYDVVFTSTYDTNLGFQERELVNVMLDSKDVADEKLWSKIEKAVKSW